MIFKIKETQINKRNRVYFKLNDYKFYNKNQLNIPIVSLYYIIKINSYSKGIFFTK